MKSRDWLAFRMGAECGRAVKTLPAEHRDTLTALYETQRRQLAEIGVRSDWHDGALLELEGREDIVSRALREDELADACAAVLDPTPVDDGTARENLRRVREAALRYQEELDR